MVDGAVVKIPTRLFVESTYKVLMSNVELPDMLALPLMVRPVPTMAAALRPFEINNEPEKELEAVPDDTNSFDMVRSPVNE